MLKAVLLDLDNTMVLYDELLFYERYFKSISVFFTDVFPPETFQERVIQAALALGDQDGSRSNQDFFMAHFLDGYDGSAEDIWQRFEAYYTHEFKKISVPIAVPKDLQHTLERLQRRDLKLVLASIPTTSGHKSLADRDRWIACSDTHTGHFFLLSQLA